MGGQLKILILEDLASDAELMAYELRQAGIAFSFKRVEDRKGFLQELEEFGPHLILSDYSLPSFDGLAALALAQEKCPEVPFIFVTGAMGEEVAIDTLKRGATDYVLKDRLSRLVPAVKRAVREAEDRRERRRVEEALRRREAVLAAVSFAAQRFLGGTSWEEDILGILGRLGEAMDVCRVYLFENHRREDGALLTSRRYEWVAPGCKPQIGNPELQGFPWREGGLGRWEETLGQGLTIQGHIRDFPGEEQGVLASQDIKSLVVVPIFLGQEWWGFIGFDSCVAEREWCLIERDALKAAASTLGAALQHERAERVLRESEQRLRFLTSQLLTAQERERKRISMELHDELGQSLTVLKLQMRNIERELHPDQWELKENSGHLLHYLDEVIDNVRRLSRDLSPSFLEDLGLQAALKYLVDGFGKDYEVSCAFELEEMNNLFPQEAQIIIYRIFQEALTNILKHAQAGKVSIVIKKQQGHVSFVVEDDGAGFDMAQVMARNAAARGLGLAALDERARMLGGSLKIWSQPGVGTRITCDIPLAHTGNQWPGC
jgi:signal transduction histidine kinase